MKLGLDESNIGTEEGVVEMKSSGVDVGEEGVLNGPGNVVIGENDMELKKES